MTFEDFQFEPTLVEGYKSMGFQQPTPIQEQAIPFILQGKDLIACAQTGTGKTAAYLLPILNKIIQKGHGSINTLILVPTRELAVQIDSAIQALTYFTEISAIAVYGGNDGQMFEQEKRAFQTEADIIVATPGRLISHLTHNYAKFHTLQTLILDEADRMLDMGFIDAINRIISHLPENRQTLMFSATMPSKIRSFAKKLLKDPEQINIALSKPAEGVTQEAYVVFEEQKMALLRDVLKAQHLNTILIFSSTKEKVKNLERDLLRQKYNAAAIHSDLEQIQRKEVLRQFSNNNLRILVATDILSRGIDIENIDLVINYDVPGDPEDYIHRVGRTARAATKGLAITFISPRDQRKFKSIEDLIGNEILKVVVPEQLGAVPTYDPKLHHDDGPRRRPQGGGQRKGRNFKR